MPAAPRSYPPAHSASSGSWPRLLLAAMVLLAAFLVIEARSPHALMPLRIFRNRSRAGTYLITLCIGTAITGMFFFLVALSKVEDRDAGLASSLVNTGQQVGGSIGLAVLGTVASTVVSSTARSSTAAGK